MHENAPQTSSLDPEDWKTLRALGHQMLDDMLDDIAGLANGPVWQPMPEPVRTRLRNEPLPAKGTDLEALYQQFQQDILPYGTGNRHPGFMGWVHGGGTPVGMLAELLAAGLNANLGGRDHAPVEVERKVIRWVADILGMPEDCSGLLVTGSSLANLIAVITASRTVPDGLAMRENGINGRKLVGYAGETAHGCLARAFDIAGLGAQALRRIPVDADFRIDLHALKAAITADRAAGLEPFLLVGTAGTVDTGAIDPLLALSEIARNEKIWFHVDGAFGALARLSPTLRPALAGIEQADSIAFDFHKWAQVPYDCGCVLVRDSARQAAAFAQSLAYLTREDRGLAAGAPWFCDFGPDLSRGFRALKVWMTLATFGTEKLAAMVDQCCAVAQHLAQRVQAEPRLELLAPVALNITCFRLRGTEGMSETDIDGLNVELVKDLHESGIAAPSMTTIHGRKAIRAAIVNHRTGFDDVDRMIDTLLATGR